MIPSVAVRYNVMIRRCSFGATRRSRETTAQLAEKFSNGLIKRTLIYIPVDAIRLGLSIGKECGCKIHAYQIAFVFDWFYKSTTLCATINQNGLKNKTYIFKYYIYSSNISIGHSLIASISRFSLIVSIDRFSLIVSFGWFSLIALIDRPLLIASISRFSLIGLR